MPQFICPKCGKHFIVPLAHCEPFLGTELSPLIGEHDGIPVYSAPCEDCLPKKIEIVHGDLLDQDVDVIVNAWNRNIIPWWLLLPQGVSGAIKRKGGTDPFKELAKHGPMSLGTAVLTSAGKLPFKGIIHVAGINMLWRASERSIRDSVRNAMKIAVEHGFVSIAFPLIGAGSGGFNQERAKQIMTDALGKCEGQMAVRLVVFRQ